MWGEEKIAGRRWKMRKRAQLFATVSQCKNDVLGMSCQTKKVTGNGLMTAKIGSWFPRRRYIGHCIVSTHRRADKDVSRGTLLLYTETVISSKDIAKF